MILNVVYCMYNSIMKGDTFMHYNTKTERIGEKTTTHQGFEIEIVEYNSATDVIVEFNDRYHSRKKTLYLYFKNQQVQCPSCFVLYDKAIAYKEDIKNNKIAYEKYRAMFDRCYGKQDGNNVAYKGCEVCEEWFKFENFVTWFNDNYYEIDGQTMELDKDLFGNGKLYSPQTCIFLPHRINSIFTRSENRRKKNKDLPKGVHTHKRQNGSTCYRVLRLRKDCLFDNVEDAERAYKEIEQKRKIELAEEYKDYIPKKLYDFLIS